MSAKRTRTLAALQITMQLTVKGGLLHKPRCLDARPATFEGRELQFVPDANSEHLVCQMASGKGAHQRPLARCKVMAELRRKVMEHVSMDSAMGDPMCDMTFADAAPVKVRLLEQVSAYGKKQNEAGYSLFGGGGGSCADEGMSWSIRGCGADTGLDSHAWPQDVHGGQCLAVAAQLSSG